jgi:glycogen synthase
LSDTIHDPIDTEQSTGFLFKPGKSKLWQAIQRALMVYVHDPQTWQAMQIRDGARFSWPFSTGIRETIQIAS